MIVTEHKIALNFFAQLDKREDEMAGAIYQHP